MEGQERNKRRSVNALNILVTCIFLFFAIKFSDGGGGFATKINKITENLDRALLGLTDTVNYTDYQPNETYLSSTQFHARGMAGLYNLTRMFIDTIVPKDILMDGLVILQDNQFQVGNPKYQDTLYYYRGLVAIVLFLVICVVLFPLCGLCFCCCRCCGNCGARSQPADKKRDLCKKVFEGSLLILLGTGLLFCVVCAFGSNQQLQEGLDNWGTNMENSIITDTSTFMTSTSKEAEHLMVTNYKEFSDVFSGTMNNASDIVVEQLENYSKATAMLDLVNFTDNVLPNLRDTLENLKAGSNKLRVYASQLNDAVRKVKRDLLNTLAECGGVSLCDDIRNNVSTLQTSIDFNQLPDVSEVIDNLDTKINISEIQTAADEGRQKLENVKTQINNTINIGIQGALDQVDKSGQLIQNNLDNVTSTINRIKNQLNDSASPTLKKVQKYISEYGKYRYYTGLAISCILLLVTLCIALGLICGVCGKRPDGYSDNCCNKGAGSQFLLCSVWIMFFFGFLLAILTVALLVLGIASERAICYPIKNPDPEQSRIVRLLDGFNLQTGVNIKVSEVLSNCYQNKSIYNTFNLKQTFDLDEIKKQFNITKQLDGLNFTKSIDFSDFKILSNESFQALQDLKKLDPSINFDQFKDELERNFTNYSLSDLSKKLESIIKELVKVPGTEDTVSALHLSVLHLNTYNEKLLNPMKDMAAHVVDTATRLDEDLKMGRGSFGEAISDLTTEIQEAQNSLAVNGSRELSRIADEFKNTTLSQVNGYLDRVFDHVENKIGQCGPLSLAINATLTSTCDKVILPWNGFWFSLFWTVILYIITIIIAVKLANLYQKYKPYGHYVETRGGKRGKKNNKKSKRYEDRSPHAGGEVVAREYAAGSRPPDGRYADMAPKHWEEFPNGGPPQYQRAPAEYERPPPYYYPGNGGEQ